MRTSTLVLTLFLAITSHAATTVGPEHAAAPVAYATVAGQPQAIATDGTNFLVVWAGYGVPLHASIISADGIVDPARSRVILRGGTLNLSAVWTGESYLVTGSSDLLGGVFSARLTRDGELMAPPVRIVGWRAGPNRLAWNGDSGLLVYQNEDGSMAFALVNARGEVVKSGIPAPWQYASAAGVEASGNGFMLVYVTAGTSVPSASAVRPLITPPPPGPAPTYHVMARRMNKSGEFIDANPVAVALGAGSPSPLALASDGQRVAIDFTTGTPGNYAIQRLVVAGDLSAQKMPDLQASTGEEFSTTAATALWNGRDFVAVWATTTNSSAAVSSAPFPSAEASPLVQNGRSAFRPFAAANSSAALVVWMDNRPSGTPSSFSAALGVLLDPDLRHVKPGVTAGFPIAFAAAAEYQPAIATFGTDSMLVWRERTNLDTDSLAAGLLDARGIAADAHPQIVGSAVTNPSVTLIGDYYLVVWCEGTPGPDARIEGVRLKRDGTAVDAMPVVYGSGWDAAVAANGTGGIVVLGGTAISAVPLNENALPAAPGALITKDHGFDPAVAWNGSEYLVTWTEGSTGWQFAPPGLRDIYAVRLTGAATPIDAAPIAVATGNDDQFDARVASDGDHFVVAYVTADNTDAGSGYWGNICAKIVMHEGALSGTTAESEGTLLARTSNNICLRRAGSGYAAAWETYATDFSSALSVAFLDSRLTTIERVDSLASSSDGSLQPALAVTPYGTIVAYSRLAQEPQYSDQHRVFVRQISSAANGRQRVVAK